MTPHQRKAQAEAEAKELDLAVKRGQFVDVSTIAGTLQAFARRIQDGVLAIPDSAHKALAGRHRCACGAVIDVRPVTVELERHLRGVLAALAEDPLGQAK